MSGLAGPPGPQPPHSWDHTCNAGSLGHLPGLSALQLGSDVHVWGASRVRSTGVPLVTALPVSCPCRKASHSGEATLQESASLQSDSLTQLVQQPDMVYFILFLWLLVYCLLLFPQLDITRL